MKELVDASFSSVNIIPTFLLLFVIGYWLVTLIGMVDLDSIDIDVDVDVDADADVDVDGGSSLMWLNHVLAFFNLGKVPLMVFLTFLALPLWAGSVLANHYVSNTSFAVSLIFLLPVLIASLFIAKFLTWPFVKVFEHMDEEEDTTVIGKICRTLGTIDHQHGGQAVVEGKSSPIKLFVRTPEGKVVPKGETALVIEYQPDKKYYLIDPYKL
ncbi:hypothetical protein SAMN05421823_103417 [Catalinimonas alkaloidigena]|uniref:DUF1449 family protein n=1 Tax=Catalinimonas alkaloidigena TaxID=1075417 RepID=A0A1G9EC60_9BACT|nr:OB-fold-containig protein [Catalinimonas alkaloidigena]SDK73651.1 hypothetical protein SAMN05421823_103417 [Catalinimonas alkaloidigena]